MHDVASAFRNAAEVGKISELSRDAAARMLADVHEKWMREAAHFWWWESFKSPPVVIEFRDALEPSRILGTLVNPEEVVCIAIMDDKDPPWPIFVGERRAINAVQMDSRVFEYLLVAENRNWLVFESHENRLWVSGYFLTVDPVKPLR